MKTKRFALKTRAVAIFVALAAIGYTTYIAFLAPEWHLTALRFNPFALISVLTVMLNLVLLFYFLYNVARTEERTWLSVYLAGLVLFSICELMQRLSATPIGALFWGGMSGVSLIVAPAIYLFSLTYTNQSERRYNGVIITLLFSGVIFFFYECFTNIVFINSTKYAVAAPWGYDFRTAIGPASGVLLIWYDVLLAAALARLISFRRHTQNKLLRKQSLLFIFAISLPLIGGTLTDLILPMLGFSNIPSLGVTLGTPAAFLFIYGLRRYQLLTVNPTLFSNTIMGTMKESVVVTDDKFNIIFTNSQADELLDIKEGGQASKSLLSFIAHDSQSMFEKSFAGAVSGQTLTIDEVDIAPVHAQHVPTRITSTLMRVGEYQTNVMIITDITQELHTRSIIEHEVKVRTEELNRARAYLVDSINSLAQGFVLVNREMKVELLNGRASTLVGINVTDATGKELTDVLGRLKWNKDLPATVQKVLDVKHHRRLDVESEDGAFYQVYVTPIISGERELGAAIIIEDVTEQKILDRSKDEFFSIASHELRTPLTAIRGNMSMIKDYFPDALKDESMANMINDTHEASIRLIEIVNDFLDSSSLEQGKMQFNIAPVDILPAFTTATDGLHLLAEKQHDTITLTNMNKVPKVMADDGRLRQIAYNLLANAVKYTENGTITVSAAVDGQNLRISIADTGKGISPENQKLLFHKFQQAGESILTRDDTKGTGLGLYISRLLAKNMHGDVVLESAEVGKGSTFVIILPLAKK